MNYYKEDKLLFFRGDSSVIYIEPNKIEIVALNGKTNYEFAENLTDYIHDGLTMSLQINLNCLLRVDISTDNGSISNLDYKYMIEPTIGIGMIFFMPNAFYLLRSVLYKWFPQKIKHSVYRFDSLIEPTMTIKNHYKIIQHLYELRADQGFI